jgi:hypothetical protein
MGLTVSMQIRAECGKIVCPSGALVKFPSCLMIVCSIDAMTNVASTLATQALHYM